MFFKRCIFLSRYTYPAFLFIFILFFSSPAKAGDVEGTLFLSGNQTVILRISVANNAPGNLIAQITLPPAAGPFSANPAAAKIDSGRGNVKWLVRNHQAGTLDLSVKTARSVSPGSVAGSIRYRHRGTGKMIDIQVRAR